MVGKAEKSSGRVVCIAASRTIIESAILKVNNKSSRNTGRGSTIIARISTITSGAATRVSC